MYKQGGAAIAQWISLRLLSCRPEFEYLAHLLLFKKFTNRITYSCINETLIRLLKKWQLRGRGSGQVVSVLAFNSDDPSSNLCDVNSFFRKKMCLKRTKISKKEAGVGPYFKGIHIAVTISLHPAETTLNAE